MTHLPERLDRLQAEIICREICKSPCFMDCECNPKVQEIWKELKESLIEGES